MQEAPDRMARNAFERELKMRMLQCRMVPRFIDTLRKRRMLFERDGIRLDDAFRRITRARCRDHILEWIGKGIDQPYA